MPNLEHVDLRVNEITEVPEEAFDESASQLEHILLDGKEMFLYYPTSNEWSKYGKMLEPRHHHCSAYMDGYVYIIGGCNPKDTKTDKIVARKSCFKFDVKSEKWHKIAKMNHCRMYHAVSTLGGKIYVVGGKDHNDRLLRSIEVYHPEENVWKELDSPLDTPTMGMGVTVQGGKLWIIGGMVQDLSGKICVTNEVKSYDPKKEKWMHEVKDLPDPRAFGTAVTFEDRIFIIGGTTCLDNSLEELESLNSVLHYEFKTNRWVITSELPSARHFVEVSALEKNLFSLGGLSSKAASIDDVLLHDESSGSWKQYGTLPKALCGFSAATIPEL
ncbi:beta-scruin-like [Uloborus diversus]|uniref:beta-scruin-like n=1 Tax=Uloborus diversus TaxID=327109 RepID=UPI00240937D9|nr:beta-scruin-like [Uloborus diversus]